MGAVADGDVENEHCCGDVVVVKIDAVPVHEAAVAGNPVAVAVVVAGMQEKLMAQDSLFCFLFDLQFLSLFPAVLYQFQFPTILFQYLFLLHMSRDRRYR